MRKRTRESPPDSAIFSLGVENGGGLTRVGTAEAVSRDNILGTNGDREEFILFSLFSAGHKQKWRPYTVDAQSASYQVDVMTDSINKFPP